MKYDGRSWNSFLPLEPRGHDSRCDSDTDVLSPVAVFHTKNQTTYKLSTHVQYPGSTCLGRPLSWVTTCRVRPATLSMSRHIATLNYLRSADTCLTRSHLLVVRTCCNGQCKQINTAFSVVISTQNRSGHAPYVATNTITVRSNFHAASHLVTASNISHRE